jgi:putative nucleotidyltransferase with HDIG domain
MSHVKGHTRTVNGKRTFIKPHEDSRARMAVKNRTGRRHVVPADPGMVKMRDYVTGLLKTEEGRQELAEKIKAGGFARGLAEVAALHGLEQASYHVDRDAFAHTMAVLKNLPEHATDNQRWAALLHDIGKAGTQRYSKSRGMIVFDGHERAGGKLAREALSRLQFDQPAADEILYLIANHHRIRSVMAHSDSDEEKRQFASHEHFDSLHTLHRADVLASGRDPQEVDDAVAAAKKQLEEKKTI